MSITKKTTELTFLFVITINYFFCFFFYCNTEVQTDRPYVAPPKLYREAIVQTDLGFDIGEPSDVDQTLRSESSHKNLSLKFGIKENTAEEITDSQIHGNGNVAVELPPTTTRRHGNRCSTQRGTVQATNAQPMSLDMSPIKQKAPPLKHREQPTIAPSEQELSRLTDGRHIERNILDEVGVQKSYFCIIILYIYIC